MSEERDWEVFFMWKDFWEPIVAPEGKLDLEQVKKELYDYRQMMKNVSGVYEHVTGGKISKPNTHALHVISEYESTVRKERDRAKPIIDKVREMSVAEDDMQDFVSDLIELMINYDNS